MDSECPIEDRRKSRVVFDEIWQSLVDANLSTAGTCSVIVMLSVKFISCFQGEDRGFAKEEMIEGIKFGIEGLEKIRNEAEK